MHAGDNTISGKELAMKNVSFGGSEKCTKNAQNYKKAI
jgi:hypothetical protein